MAKNIPKYIIIHCSDVSYRNGFDQFDSINTYHRDVRMFPISALGYFIGYQRLITGDKNYQARLDTDVGAHCNQGIDVNGNPIEGPVSGTSMNFQSLGICIGFDGDIEMPTARQYALLQEQIWKWQDQYGITNDRVYFHRKFALTKTCPGSLITQAWLDQLLARPGSIVAPPNSPESRCDAEIAQIKEQQQTITLLQQWIEALKALFNTNPMNKKFGVFSASDDPEQLGSTVKAFILGLSVLIIYAAQLILKIQLTPEDITTFATDLGALATLVWAGYGLVKKVVVWSILKWHTKVV